MNEDITALLIIAAIVQIAFLVYFYNLCADVVKIRKNLTEGPTNHLAQYRKHKAFGNNEKAKESLENFIWDKALLVKRDTKSSPSAKKEYYDGFRNTHEPRLNDLGGVWPAIDLFK